MPAKSLPKGTVVEKINSAPRDGHSNGARGKVLSAFGAGYFVEWSTCLEKDPDMRWQSAHDVKRALELAGRLSPLLTPRRRGYQWAAWTAAAVILLAAATLLAVRRGPGPAAADVVSFLVYPPQGTAFSASPNTTVNVPQFALSPDGRTLAFVASATGAPPMLWLRPLGAVESHQLPGTENAQAPFWSPDNHWLGFYSEGKIKKVPAAAGAVQVVA
jgi:dipeptidyl aminopeptidase/acylaminoacyl peptidase